MRPSLERRGIFGAGGNLFVYKFTDESTTNISERKIMSDEKKNKIFIEWRHTDGTIFGSLFWGYNEN